MKDLFQDLKIISGVQQENHRRRMHGSSGGYALLLIGKWVHEQNKRNKSYVINSSIYCSPSFLPWTPSIKGTSYKWPKITCLEKGKNRISKLRGTLQGKFGDSYILEVTRCPYNKC